MVKTEHVSLRFDAPTKAALIKAAEADRRSMSSMIQKIVAEWLDQNPIEKDRTDLIESVRALFHTLSNESDAFRKLLFSNNHTDSLTGNRMFDQFEAIRIIKDTARKNADSIVANAKEGDIYRCITRIMREHRLAPHLQPAES